MRQLVWDLTNSNWTTTLKRRGTLDMGRHWVGDTLTGKRPYEDKVRRQVEEKGLRKIQTD